METTDDRCNTCLGTGLVWHEGANRDERCLKCNGSGKQSDVPAEYEIGTMVIKPDGAYLQTNKGLIKQ